MQRYPYLLFDADNTLFCFDKANRFAFARMCRVCGLPFSDGLLACYERHNNAAWEKMERGEATKERIVVERFETFFAEIGADCDPELANRLHLAALGECSFLMPHALEVVQTLAEKHRLFLVTNAVASVQKSRLARSELAPYIEAAFISEELGAAKPSEAYFDRVFERIDGITKENCLVIGDSLTSDILGANRYGLPTCWFNIRSAPRPETLRIDYEIFDLRELYDIV